MNPMIKAQEWIDKFKVDANGKPAILLEDLKNYFTIKWTQADNVVNNTPRKIGDDDVNYKRGFWSGKRTQCEEFRDLEF